MYSPFARAYIANLPAFVQSEIERPLSPREIQIVGLVALGHTNMAIAAALSISDQTVKNHIANAMEKTGAESRLDLALMALARGWAPEDVLMRVEMRAAINRERSAFAW
jgi:DNA-binding NarL/FixJ family response regulator